MSCVSPVWLHALRKFQPLPKIAVRRIEIAILLSEDTHVIENFDHLWRVRAQLPSYLQSLARETLCFRHIPKTKLNQRQFLQIVGNCKRFGVNF